MPEPDESPPAHAHERTDSDRSADPVIQGARERFGAFYLVYVGIFALLFAYLITVRIAEALLDAEFQTRVELALTPPHAAPPAPGSSEIGIESQISLRLAEVVQGSRWVRWGGLRVTTLVLGQDESSWLYFDGRGARPPHVAHAPALTQGTATRDHALGPASAVVTATLPHNSLVSNGILILYSSVLLFVISISNRRLIQRETHRLGDALGSRNSAARRAAEIEAELSEMRSRLSQIEPVEREQSEEIESLVRERQGLQRQLEGLAAREENLRGQARQALDLSQEVRALEDLLEEATGDLSNKDEEIDRLEQNLRQVSRTSGKAKTKVSGTLTKRYRTLYKAIEIDDRAIEGLADLGDEGLRLKAEEAIKRLAEDAENVSIRRKVAGLPAHVHVYELGFAGKGRIYYARGKSRRFRILLVGAKNTQTVDLDYLGRLPKDTFQ